MHLTLLVLLAGAGSMELRSSAFAAGSAIPRAHGCEGEDRAPALSWSGLPAGTRSVALVVHDPDAPDPKQPRRDWVHWVVYGISPTVTGLPGGGALPAGARQGKNDFGAARWGGPCPPVGRHRYFFELYALDVELPDLHVPTRAQLDAAMKGHVIARAELVGTYQKGDP